MAQRRKVWIDCDAGCDDAQALLMALSHDDVDVIGISTVIGNVEAMESAVNVLHVLRVAEKTQVPVFCGSVVNLRGDIVVKSVFHGHDGLGDCQDPSLVNVSDVRKERAANALVRMVNENVGEVTLIVLGPLTNVAVALHLDPELGGKLKELYVMGGNTTGAGNITPAAEFNFYADADAARMVLEQVKVPFTMVPFELCQDNSISWELYHKLIARPEPIAQFVKAIDEERLTRSTYVNYPAFDQLAMAVMLDNRVATATRPVYATICTDQGLCRGQVIIDWKDKFQRTPNVKLVTKIDNALYNDLYWKTLTGGIPNSPC